MRIGSSSPVTAGPATSPAGPGWWSRAAPAATIPSSGPPAGDAAPPAEVLAAVRAARGIALSAATSSSASTSSISSNTDDPMTGAEVSERDT